jgi:hypothetical protein
LSLFHHHARTSASQNRRPRDRNVTRIATVGNPVDIRMAIS